MHKSHHPCPWRLSYKARMACSMIVIIVVAMEVEATVTQQIELLESVS